MSTPPSPAMLIERLLQQQSSPGQRRDNLVLGVLTTIIGVLCVVLCIILLPMLRQYLNRRRRSKVPQKRLDRRYATIDSWLIRKAVRAHNNTCYRVQKYYGIHAKKEDIAVLKEKAKKSTLPIKSEGITVARGPVAKAAAAAGIVKLRSTADSCGCGYVNNPNKPPEECPICMEEFKVGDSVSWSTDPDCGHVFHHQCIREWLLRHIGCPYCRCTFLPVDRPVPPEALLAPQPEPTETAQSSPRHHPASVAPDTNGGTAWNVNADHNSYRQSRMSAVTDTVSLVWYGNRRIQQQERQKQRNRQKSSAYVKVLTQERALRCRTTYYCIADGLVTLRTSAAAEAKAAEDAKTSASASKKKMRNRRILADITSTRENEDTNANTQSPPRKPSTHDGATMALQMMDDGSVVDNDPDDMVLASDGDMLSVVSSVASVSSSVAPTLSSESASRNTMRPPSSLLVVHGGTDQIAHDDSDTENEELFENMEMLRPQSSLSMTSLSREAGDESSVTPTLDSAPTLDSNWESNRSIVMIPDDSSESGDGNEDSTPSKPPSLLTIDSSSQQQSVSNVGIDEEDESDTENDELLNDVECQPSELDTRPPSMLALTRQRSND